MWVASDKISVIFVWEGRNLVVAKYVEHVFALELFALFQAQLYCLSVKLIFVLQM